MRTLVISLLLAGLVFAPAASAAERCNARGAKTVLQNSQARLFSVKGKGEVKRRFYGCMRGRKPRLLATNFSPRDAEQTAFFNKSFRLGGPYVAWVQEAFSDFGVGEFGRSIEVRSLGPARPTVSQDVSDYDSVSALSVRNDGAVGWILATGGPYNEVDAVESAAKLPTALAYARGIAPGDLRVDATSVHWTQDGADRSAEVR